MPFFGVLMRFYHTFRLLSVQNRSFLQAEHPISALPESTPQYAVLLTGDAVFLTCDAVFRHSAIYRLDLVFVLSDGTLLVRLSISTV